MEMPQKKVTVLQDEPAESSLLSGPTDEITEVELPPRWARHVRTVPCVIDLEAECIDLEA